MKLSRSLGVYSRGFAIAEKIRGLARKMLFSSERCIGKLQIECSHLANTTGVHLQILLLLWTIFCRNVFAFLSEVQ